MFKKCKNMRDDQRQRAILECSGQAYSLGDRLPFISTPLPGTVRSLRILNRVPELDSGPIDLRQWGLRPRSHCSTASAYVASPISMMHHRQLINRDRVLKMTFLEIPSGQPSIHGVDTAVVLKLTISTQFSHAHSIVALAKWRYITQATE